MNKEAEIFNNEVIDLGYANEIIQHIKEYLSVMKDEPDEYILLSKVYHDLRRILGDE